MPSHNPNAAVMCVLRPLVIHTMCFVALFRQLVMTRRCQVLHLWPNTCFVLNQDGVYSVPSWPWLETKPYEIHGLSYKHLNMFHFSNTLYSLNITFFPIQSSVCRFEANNKRHEKVIWRMNPIQYRLWNRGLWARRPWF